MAHRPARRAIWKTQLWTFSDAIPRSRSGRPFISNEWPPLGEATCRLNVSEWVVSGRAASGGTGTKAAVAMDAAVPTVTTRLSARKWQAALEPASAPEIECGAEQPAPRGGHGMEMG